MSGSIARRAHGMTPLAGELGTLRASVPVRLPGIGPAVVSAILLTLLCTFVVGDRARAEEAPVLSPQARYDRARQAMQQARYGDAEVEFRAVVEAPDASRELRAQALFSVGLMQQNQRRYEDALGTFRRVIELYPGTPLAQRAEGAVATLTEGGVETGVAFRARYDEMMEAYTLGREASEREGAGAGRAALEKAAATADGLQREFPNHPRLGQVAFQAGEIAVALEEFSLAQRHYERALALAGGVRDPDASIDTLVTNSHSQLVEAGRKQRRWWSTRGAWLVLACLGVALVGWRPWQMLDASWLRPATVCALAVTGVASIGEGFAWFVRTYLDDHSPVTEGLAFFLVAAPGFVGLFAAMGFLAGFRRAAPRRADRAALYAAGLGALAAFAITVWIVNAYELSPFPDADL